MIGRLDWSGVFPAALTHFSATGDLDLDATAEHLDWLIQQGAHGLIVGGTSGEFIALTLDEHRALIDIAVAAAAGKVSVIVGAGRYSTAESVALTDHAARAGADGVLIVQPYFQRPSRSEILQHYRTVGAVGVPLMVYNIPANSASEAVSVADLAMLHAEGVAQAVKSTLPTVNQIHEIRAATDDSFRVFYGGISSPLEGLAGGAHAWVSGLLNVVVPESIKLWAAVASSDLAAAREAWLPIARVADLVNRFRADASDLAVYRAILQIEGRTPGHSRAPLLALPSERVRDLEHAYAVARQY